MWTGWETGSGTIQAKADKKEEACLCNKWKQNGVAGGVQGGGQEGREGRRLECGLGYI